MEINGSNIIFNNEHETIEANISLILGCPEFTKSDWTIISACRYWISGITLCGVGLLGLILNITAICMLASRASKRIFFNNLLIGLFIFDSVFVFLEIVDKFRDAFSLLTDIHIFMYPYVLRPLTKISFTSSIFMTVAIAYERYVAVKRPVIHRRSLVSSKFRKRNLMKYLCCVITCSITFNVPIWFESEIRWKNKMSTNLNETSER